MSANEARECGVAYAWDLLNCLSGVLETKLEAKHVDLVKYFDQIVPRLFGLAVSATTPRMGDVEPIFRDRRLLALVSRMTETLTWELTVESVSCFQLSSLCFKLRRYSRQTKQFAAVYNAFEKGEMANIVYKSETSKTSFSSPLRVSVADVCKVQC